MSKIIRETENFVTFDAGPFGEVTIMKWESFQKLEKTLGIADKENDVNEDEVQEGYDELTREYIGAP